MLHTITNLKVHFVGIIYIYELFVCQKIKPAKKGGSRGYLKI